jgi:hypothetical protein
MQMQDLSFKVSAVEPIDVSNFVVWVVDAIFNLVGSESYYEGYVYREGLDLVKYTARMVNGLSHGTLGQALLALQKFINGVKCVDSFQTRNELKNVLYGPEEKDLYCKWDLATTVNSAVNGADTDTFKLGDDIDDERLTLTVTVDLRLVPDEKKSTRRAIGLGKKLVGSMDFSFAIWKRDPNGIGYRGPTIKQFTPYRYRPPVDNNGRVLDFYRYRTTMVPKAARCLDRLYNRPNAGFALAGRNVQNAIDARTLAQQQRVLEVAEMRGGDNPRPVALPAGIAGLLGGGEIDAGPPLNEFPDERRNRNPHNSDDDDDAPNMNQIIDAGFDDGDFVVDVDENVEVETNARNLDSPPPENAKEEVDEDYVDKDAPQNNPILVDIPGELEAYKKAQLEADEEVVKKASQVNRKRKKNPKKKGKLVFKKKKEEPQEDEGEGSSEDSIAFRVRLAKRMKREEEEARYIHKKNPFHTPTSALDDLDLGSKSSEKSNQHIIVEKPSEESSTKDVGKQSSKYSEEFQKYCDM